MTKDTAPAYGVRAYISILAHSEMIRLEIELTILWIQFTSAGCHSVDTIYFCKLSFSSHRPLSFWSYSTRCISSFSRSKW